MTSVTTTSGIYSVETLADGSMGDLRTTPSPRGFFSRIAIEDGLIVADPMLGAARVEWRGQLVCLDIGEEIEFTIVAASDRIEDAFHVLRCHPLVRSLVNAGWLVLCPWLVGSEEF